jgi:hypothetical protein
MHSDASLGSQIHLDTAAQKTRECVRQQSVTKHPGKKKALCDYSIEIWNKKQRGFLAHTVNLHKLLNFYL